MLPIQAVYDGRLSEEDRIAVLLYHVFDLLSELYHDEMIRTMPKGSARLTLPQRTRAAGINEIIAARYPRALKAVEAAELPSATSDDDPAAVTTEISLQATAEGPQLLFGRRNAVS